jgi:hypothetical protein
MSRRHTLPPSSEEKDDSTLTPIYSEKYYDLFKCPFCKEYFNPPIVECKNKHSICQDCSIESEISESKVCPLCHSKVEPRRHLEQLMHDHKLDCIFKSRGCPFEALHGYSKHVKSCDFKSKLKCYHSLLCSLKSSCKWEGLEENFFSHFIEDHKILKYEPVKINETFIMTSHLPDAATSRNSFLIIQVRIEDLEPKELLLEFIYMSMHKRLFYLLRSKERGLNLKYELSLLNPETKESEKTLNLTTCDFSGNYLVDTPNISSKYLGYFYLSKVEKFKFFKSEDSPGFMLSVKFL